MKTPEDQSPAKDSKGRNLSSNKKVFNYQKVIEQRQSREMPVMPVMQYKQKSENFATFGLKAQSSLVPVGGDYV